MILYRYILRSLIGPFLFGFITLMFVFLLQLLRFITNELVGKGLGTWVILQLIIYNLAWMVVLAAPMSVLIATLMAFGTLSSTSEITAMRAAGMSLKKMLTPVMAGAALLTVLTMWFNDRVLPDWNHKASVLRMDIRQKKPTFALEAGKFYTGLEGYSIFARSSDVSTNKLYGVTVFDNTRPQRSVVLTAREGTVALDDASDVMTMFLVDGEIHNTLAMPVARAEYRRLHFERHIVRIPARGFALKRSREEEVSRGDRELSSGAMLAIVDGYRNETARAEKSIEESSKIFFSLAPALASQAPAADIVQARARALERLRTLRTSVDREVNTIGYRVAGMNGYLVEIHKKFSIPVACLVFALVGVPLGILARQGGIGVGSALSIGFFIVYWACLIGGEKLADRGLLGAATGMWIGDAVLGVMGIVLALMVGRGKARVSWKWLKKIERKKEGADGN